MPDRDTPAPPPDDALAEVLARMPEADRRVVEQHLRSPCRRRGGEPAWKTQRRRARDLAIQTGAREFLARGCSLSETADQVMAALRRKGRPGWCRDALESGAPIPKQKQIQRIILKNNK